MSLNSHQRSRSRHISRACFETLEDRRLFTFSPATSFPVDTYPEAVVTADFNNDGKLDLATSNYDQATGDSTVSVLLGNGDGSFQPARTSATGAYPFSLAAGDFNADGKVDLATGNYDYSEVNDVTILLGHGDGTFAAPVALDVSVAYSWSIASGDLNADGKPDLVVTSDDVFLGGYVSVLLDHGDGTFQTARPFTAEYGPGSATASDVNGDGKLDLVVTNGGSTSSPGAVSVLLGNGDGSLARPITTATGGTYTNSVVMADFNGDGRPDAAAAGSNNLSVLLNDGNWPQQTTPPRININDVTKAEGKNRSSTSFTFTVSLSAAYDQPVTVSYRTVNGTATAGSDYTSKTGAITFAPGETTKTITIQVKGDNKRESIETLYLELFNNSSNSLLTRTRGIGTILNDEN